MCARWRGRGARQQCRSSIPPPGGSRQIDDLGSAHTPSEVELCGRVCYRPRRPLTTPCRSETADPSATHGCAEQKECDQLHVARVLDLRWPRHLALDEARQIMAKRRALLADQEAGIGPSTVSPPRVAQSWAGSTCTTSRTALRHSVTASRSTVPTAAWRPRPSGTCAS